jgi:hypothetical protein
MVAYKTFSKRKYSISQIEFNLIMLTNISNRESQVMGKKRTGKIQKQFPFQKANHNSTILSAHQLRMVEERGPKLIHAFFSLPLLFHEGHTPASDHDQ